MLKAKSGYWNVKLERRSSYYTTFNSPFGRYRFLRMPFSLKMSQDVFQSKIDQTFEGYQGVVGICDDIVVYGKTKEEHDSNFCEMLERCKKTGLKINWREKDQILWCHYKRRRCTTRSIKSYCHKRNGKT